ncbi:unnamed protein product [Prunus armeniaca]|uniref:DUF4216 domain-containing protein n=1 Tax=Prunus armeniaca TaxID=36596 RepID=A0A6J5V486_PRUAR|nr:unnamed protein product [Prunus armeniaca]
MATHVSQVFYIDDPEHDGWSIVLPMPNKVYVHSDELEDDVLEHQSFTNGLQLVEEFKYELGEGETKFALINLSMGSTKKIPVKPLKEKPKNHSNIPQSNEASSLETTITTMSEPKRKRGPTEMHKIQKKKKKGKKLVVEFSPKGEPMGKVGKQYASYTGIMAQTIIPIHICNWAAVDDHLKEKIWTKITSVFELLPESKQPTLQSASTKWRQFKSTLTREYVLPHRNDLEALKEPLEMYDFIELSDWQSFVISRLSENWQVACEDKNGKILDEEVAELVGTIEKLLKEKEEGLIIVSRYNDVLAMALGTPEHGGSVRDVGGFVKPNAFFKVPRKKRECV